MSGVEHQSKCRLRTPCSRNSVKQPPASACNDHTRFLRATACNAKRVFAMAEASDCPSVTLLYCVTLRIMKSSLCDSLESLVSNEVMMVPLGEEIPLERWHQTGYPP